MERKGGPKAPAGSERARRAESQPAAEKSWMLRVRAAQNPGVASTRANSGGARRSAVRSTMRDKVAGETLGAFLLQGSTNFDSVWIRLGRNTKPSRASLWARRRAMVAVGVSSRTFEARRLSAWRNSA